ncbi:MAG: methylamine utilization protein MauG [Campylobacterales bacterium]|nr:methylamine utilization protein MauG [Campylobacterales bacterium]
MKQTKYLATSLVLATLFLGCSSDDSNSTTCGNEDVTRDFNLSTKEGLGESLFFDKTISLNRNVSCNTCHNANHGFVDARFNEDCRDQSVFIHGAFSVGSDGTSLGGRNAPTASYAQFSPEFEKQADGTYKGGQFWDGRASTLKAQAGGPPLDGAEMQMANKNAVVDRIKENPEYIKAFKALYGENIFDDINASYESMAEAIGKFEKTSEFAPFDSKYDRSKLSSSHPDHYQMTMEEDLGYSLFFSTANTSCVKCHSLNSTSEASSKELFTNFEYENIGTPRNISAMNKRVDLGLQDASAKFLGLGNTVKSSDSNWSAHLGKAKVPTLRNIAVTGPYMSNGVFKKLRTVLEFYDHVGGSGDRPNNPETGKPWGNNDHNSTINHADLTQNQLTDTKIKALEAFLRLLTDKKYEHLLPELAPEGELGN